MEPVLLVSGVSIAVGNATIDPDLEQAPTRLQMASVLSLPSTTRQEASGQVFKCSPGTPHLHHPHNRLQHNIDNASLPQDLQDREREDRHCAQPLRGAATVRLWWQVERRRHPEGGQSRSSPVPLCKLRNCNAALTSSLLRTRSGLSRRKTAAGSSATSAPASTSASMATSEMARPLPRSPRPSIGKSSRTTRTRRPTGAQPPPDLRDHG